MIDQNGDNELMIAIKSKNKKEVEEILKSGFNEDQYNFDEKNAFALLLEEDLEISIEAFKILIAITDEKKLDLIFTNWQELQTQYIKKYFKGAWYVKLPNR